MGSLLLSVSLIFFLSAQQQHSPQLININPVVGEPGDIMTITGRYFGTKQTDSHVEIGGSKLTASAYVLWTDTLIKAILPYNVSDGLVYVETKSGRSAPCIFASKQTLPIPLRHDPQTTVPLISSIKTSGSIGSIMTISGSNFGSLRGTSRVFFTAAKSAAADTGLISCSEFDTDYQFWSTNELQVRIPDGAVNGQVYVETEQGRSGGWPYNLTQEIGTKTYSDMRTYLVKVSADVVEAEAEQHATLTLFIPLPPLSASQRSVEILTSAPEPSIKGYMNTLVHQVTLNEASNHKLNFLHDFVLGIYSVKSEINSRQVRPCSETTQKLYSQYLKGDDIVPARDTALIDLSTQIIQKEKNPWLQARLLYDWLLANIVLLPKLRAADENVLSALKAKAGDAYDFAVLYTALLRSVGIPSVTNAGILVDSEMKSRNHWWCEFYIEGAGWIPADPALGAGLEYKAFQQNENIKNFYFGNLDAQHITFSRGWNNIKPAHINGKKVYRPKSFALQSIWEEASAGAIKYSSFWSDALVAGIY